MVASVRKYGLKDKGRIWEEAEEEWYGRIQINRVVWLLDDLHRSGQVTYS
jgi:hypothetical protein